MSENEENGTALQTANSNVAVQNQEPEQLTISKETFQATEDMLAELTKNIKDKKLSEVEITAEYFDFDKGTELTGIFTGWTWISAKQESARAVDGKIKAAKILGTDKKFVINAASVLVSSLEGYKYPMAVRIACTGEKENKNGKYQTFSIKALV